MLVFKSFFPEDETLLDEEFASDDIHPVIFEIATLGKQSHFE